MLCVQNNFAEALAAFEEAERLAGPAPLILGNKGLALWKLGRPQEALSCFEQAYTASPDELVTVTNYSLLLADVGRLEEAKDKLAWAEHLYTSQRILRAKMLGECRKKVWGEEPRDGD